MERCHICGRPDDGKSLHVSGRVLCSVCERITVRILPQHPLYGFWVRMLHGISGAQGA